MTEQQEPVKKAKGGAQPGAGRPKGSLNKTTLEAMAVKRGYLDKVRKNVDRLFNAQMNLAEGVTMLFKVKRNDNNKSTKPELVTDEATIARFIDECGGYEGTLDGDTYFFLTTKVPDSKTISDMLDRALGKPEQSIDLTTDGESFNTPTVRIIDERQRHTDTE